MTDAKNTQKLKVEIASEKLLNQMFDNKPGL